VGDGSVRPDKDRATTSPGGSWRLTAPHRDNAQGLIVSGFPCLPVGRALLLQLPPGGGGGWLEALTQAVPITSAAGMRAPSVALALTYTGLKAMDLDTDTLATFAPAFVEGMRQIDRQRRLGDDVLTANDTVIPGGPIWSGNAPEPCPIPEEADATPTPTTVHAALLLYDKDSSELERLTCSAVRVLDRFEVAIVRRIDLSFRKDDKGRIREHFGFVDGISQPVPYGCTIEPNRRDPWHGVAAGDILIGHLNTDGDPAPGPMVSDTAPGADVLPEGPHGFRDLGLDGTYLVIRELRQDVKAFWDSMKTAAEALGGGHDHKWVAARVVGRTLDGDPLVPGGVIPPDGDGPANDFAYFRTDPQGLGCPMGSHMRRANPRDGLAPKLTYAKAFLEAANNHRILRRGRSFGPFFEENEAPDVERGLLFMAINADITRQFEFVQQTWIFNQSFAALFDETDPLVGPRGQFTVPEKPIRARVAVETFVRLVGGDYFFLPSLPALRYLAQLR
jgi:Dyp-type peroxidase family